MLKIGFVLDDSLDSTDGVQQYVLTLGKWLSSQGHDVHYLVGKTTRTDINQVYSLSRNVRVRFNKNHLTIPLPSSRQKIKELLEREHFDVLHVQMPFSPWLAGRVITAAPPHAVIFGTFHILPFSRLEQAGSRALAAWQRTTLKRFDGVVSVSRAAQSFALHSYKINSTVLPNVIDLELFHKQNISKKQTEKLEIVYLGRLVPRKGAQQLVSAIAKLPSALQRKIHVKLYGKGPLKQKLEKQIDILGLDDVVSMRGFLEEVDKPTALRADVAIFPSLGGESFGIVLLEAMASGAGVVLGGDNPGYRCVLGSIPETLINARHPERLSTELAALLTNTELRNQIHMKQQELVKSYNVASVGPQLVKLYKDIIAKRTSNKDN
jgi:phosphatidyl-myo-inositol alpha-mannosyltransferase